MSEKEPVAEPARARWRERSWPLPVVVVVALVAVLLGGIGGAALASVGDHQDGRRGFGPGNNRGFGGPGQQGPGRRGFQFNSPGHRQQQPPRPSPLATPSS